MITHTSEVAFNAFFFFVPFSRACAVGVTPTTSSAASDPWTVPASSAKAPSPTTTTLIAAGERTATNLPRKEDLPVIYPAAILSNYCAHIHTNIYFINSKCLTTDVIPAETGSELESRGSAGLTVSASRDLSKQTSYIPTLPRSGEKKGMMEAEPVNRMCSVGSRACIPVNGRLGRIPKATGRNQRTVCCQGMMGDVHVLSSGARWKTRTPIWVMIHPPLGRLRRFCSPSSDLSSTLWQICMKVLRLTTEVNRQGIASDGDSEDDTFSDNESENKRLWWEEAKSALLPRWIQK